MERQLPKCDISGDVFLIDIEKGELRDNLNSGNTIPFDAMRDLGNGYCFNYDSLVRNLPELSRASHPDTKIVMLPPLVEMDPIGMAQKFGKELFDVVGKTDLEVMVDQEALKQRLFGPQPTIDIAGQIFHVDLAWNHLRPVDDFSTLGISITDIQENQYLDGDVYSFIYDPSTRMVVEIDFDKITSMPDGLLLVEIPNSKDLDPVGYAKKTGIDLNDILKQSQVKNHHMARIIPWKETGINEIISGNIKRNKTQKTDTKKQSPKRKGRRM